MCGICGIYNKGNALISRKDIIRMRDVMLNRGPDDAGIYIGNHIGLGHRRLSIIDLSEAGRQPMCNETGSMWSAVNGEIYNFIALRESLIKRGHIFKSRTDSEVIVHGYEEWGEGVFEQLNGMYSLAIWDSDKERLILARDRVGKKPLFYMESGGSVIFASDIKSIATCVNNLEIDDAAIDCYLAHICVPQAHAIFKGVKKVPPAHYMVFDKNKTSSNKYWYLSFKDKMNITEEQCMDKTADLLKAAVKDRLISDVPIGAFLSGGVDSSLVVAFMSKLFNRKVKTFSVGFDYEPYNELPHAKRVAEKYSTEHHEFILKADYLDILPRLVWEYGEPFADSSAVPSYYISKIASEHVKVALVGDGGDESFAGYDRTQYIIRTLMYKKIMPRFISKNVISPLLKVIGNNADKSYLLNRIKFYEDRINCGARSKYKNLMGSIHCREELYSSQFKKRLTGHNPSHIYEGFYDQSNGVDDVDRVLFIDYNTIMPDDYQVKMDIASMSNSLEIRAPFLDYRMMELAAKIPSTRKLNLWQSKYLLKKLAEKYIPKENIYRRKWGFGVPIGVWFRGDLKPYLYSVILSDRAKKRGYFNYDYVKHIIEEHLAGRGYHEHKLWSLLWLELWHRMFIDKELKPSDSLKNLN